MKRGRFSYRSRAPQMDIPDEPTDRTLRTTSRNATRETFERDREYTATKTTAMDKMASKTADDGDRTATVSRCMDDRNTTEDRRQMSSSDNPWLSASSQHFHPSTRTVPDSFPDEILRWVILRGLRPWIKASIIAQKGDLKSVADILECAKVAESADLGKDDGSADAVKINQLMEDVRASRDKVQQLNAKTQLNANLARRRRVTDIYRRIHPVLRTITLQHRLHKRSTHLVCLRHHSTTLPVTVLSACLLSKIINYRFVIAVIAD